ncbi:MAG: DNA repair ATPase [Acidobacteriota bacterium]
MALEVEHTGAEAGQDGGAEATRLEQGTYEILRTRLEDQADELRRRAESLNEARLEVFGGTELALLATERIRTENNCVPRDILKVGRLLLFGYNVFLGLRTETRVEDVFSLYEVTSLGGDDGEGGDAVGFHAVALDAPESFLADDRFRRDFDELYRYYKETRLLQLRALDGKLLAVFQTGARAEDVKVFRWAIDRHGEVTYVDNRGERDHVFPSRFDFEWRETTRDDHVLGRHPHVSIEDRVFVETVGGDLTVKVEDNTEDGLGMYREPVDEEHQSLADADIHFAVVGALVLIRVRPYNETTWRHLVFSERRQSVVRIDAIGQTCHTLPEDHGVIFPGGYVLQDGEHKTFEGDAEGMELESVVRSPNGEDVLYAFYERASGRGVLLDYNLIRKQVQTPIYTHGLALFDDGKMVVFRAHDEPTRVHPMQVWRTPFMSDEHAAATPHGDSFLAKIGNADLVRGVSDALSIARTAAAPDDAASSSETGASGQDAGARYEELVASTVRMADAYYWLGREEVGDLAEPLGRLRDTAEKVLDEYEKVKAIRRRAREAVAGAETEVEELFHRLRTEPRDRVDHYVGALADLRRARGRLVSLGELRSVDTARLEALDERLVERFDELSTQTVDFLLDARALEPYRESIDALVARSEEAEKTTALKPLLEELEEIGGGLELLTEVVGSLEIDDPTERTRILEAISEILGALNRARALVEARRKELLRGEGAAEFAAQFQLLSQAVSGALAMASTPEACDEQLAKMLLQLEELEGRFGEIDDAYLEQLATKREDVYEAFSAKKQTLVDARQRRAGRLMDAAERILDGVRRRAAALADLDALNTYFVGDAMVAKVRSLADDLRSIGDAVKADEIDSRLKSAREAAARSLRDRRDIYEDGAEVLRLGRHRFSVEQRPFELTMVPRTSGRGGRGDADELTMYFHLPGTDFYEPVRDEEFQQTRGCWNQLLVSESDTVYRAEYLAASILLDAEEGLLAPGSGPSLDALHRAALAGEEGSDGAPEDADGDLLDMVRRVAAARYDEGYERGLHDHDAAKILHALLGLHASAGLLRFAPRPRSLACVFWAFYPEQTARAGWQRRARSLGRLRQAFEASPALATLQAELAGVIGAFCGDHGIDVAEDEARLAGIYLFEELARERVAFTTSAEAERLRDAFLRHLELHHDRRAFEEDLRELQDDLEQRWRLAVAWLGAFLDRRPDDEALVTLRPSLDEAAALLLTEGRLERVSSAALQSHVVDGLLGQHRGIKERRLTLRLDEFLARVGAFRARQVPRFRRFQQLRHELLEREADTLRLDEYRPKVMSAFVRNQLIDQVYLPLVGDNFAKQLGAVGADKRTDQMGLLLLVSPPGYGKTTLMEYIANRLGLIFVKVNGPALGHGVTSLDPSEAPNATARQEVDKINFALEMGNNVLLYLDDIQHTASELLQKFISLCDAQRRMEGVWNGRTRTYDLKGKRFAVVFAGNPYTESGEAFEIPDMLANRADTYNLGDILEGRERVFALSHIENALTSNATLAPLAARDAEDVRTLVRRAQQREGGGDESQSGALEHSYSAVELEEILSVLRKLLRVQETVLAVNQQYIASAAQDDRFRTEPRFQLQGSYRNMNRMAEKVVPVMNDDELTALIDDHYQGEAQTLTTGAEANLLKLAELRGTLTEAQTERWREIKRSYARVQAMGGADDDPAVKIVGQLGLLSDRLADIDAAIARAAAAASEEEVSVPVDAESSELTSIAAALRDALDSLRRQSEEQAAREETSPTSATLELPAGLGETLGARLDAFLEHLAEHLAESRASTAAAPAALLDSRSADATATPPSPPPVPAPAGRLEVDFGPYLERLDATLRQLADTSRGARIVQTLGPGVVDLLDELGATVRADLLPAVQLLDTTLAQTDADRRIRSRIDRALKNLDMMEDLVESLRKVDTSRLVTEA